MKKGIVMKRKLLYIGICSFLFAWSVLPARADGEERNEKGTTWVDPVEFYHLQDISRTDFQRDYDQGDIDFNRVLKEKGVKVYGLRLKPVAGAMRVRKFMDIGYDEEFRSADLSYQNLYGIEGVPIHEASFCVYFDESVSRKYSVDYTYSISANMDGEAYTDRGSATSSISISGLRLVASGGGVAFSYALTCNGTEKEHTSGSESMQGSMSASDVLTKLDGVDERLGHFIYFSGGRYLLAMLAATAKSTADKAGSMDLIPSEREKMINHPWPRVYFIVEQILVDASAAAAEEVAITGKPQEPVEGEQGLSAEDRTELANFVSDLVAWLKGEGDPFGLGEHTDATESAVINSIATIASILTGAGIAGFIGGTGASIASGMTDAILSGAAGSMPSPTPNTPNMPDINSTEPPKRPEEEEKKEEGEAPLPPPAEPPAQDPFAGEAFSHYVTKDADGDLTVRDPVTGKETIYINNGDGTYRNLTTDQDWTPAEIGEQLGFRDRNSALLKQDAEQAARNVAEQHEQWVNHDSQELSQEGKDYLDWKHKQEEAEKKQERIEKLAEKYGVPPNEESIKRAIKLEQSIESHFSAENKKLGDSFDKWAKGMEITEKVCDAGVNIMATCVPGGTVVKNVYTFVKEPLVGLSEAYAEEKGLSGAIGNVVVGMGKGALGVIQNEAGNLTKDMPNAAWREYGITILTENLKVGMAEYYKEGNLAKTSDAMIKAMGTKSVEFGFGKLINLGFDKLKGSSPADSWLNKPKSLGIGTRADVYKIRVDGNVSLNDNISKLGISTGDGVGKLTKIIGVSKTPGFSTFYSGKVDLGGMAEGTINEIANKAGVHNWGGSLAQADVAMRVEGLSYVIYGADKAADYINGLGETAMKYAKQEN